MKNNDFLNDISINQDEEIISILKWQENYKEGKISEKEMSDDERKKLIKLYKIQHRELMENIKNGLNQLKWMLDNYNKMWKN